MFPASEPPSAHVGGPGSKQGPVPSTRGESLGGTREILSHSCQEDDWGKDSQKEAQIFTLTYSFQKRCGTHELGLKAKEDDQGIKGKLVTSSHVRLCT